MKLIFKPKPSLIVEFKEKIIILESIFKLMEMMNSLLKRNCLFLSNPLNKHCYLLVSEKEYIQYKEIIISDIFARFELCIEIDYSKLKLMVE